MSDEVSLQCLTCGLHSEEDVGNSGRHRAELAGWATALKRPLTLQYLACKEAGHDVSRWSWTYCEGDPATACTPIAEWPDVLPNIVIRWVDRPCWQGCAHENPCGPPRELEGPDCPRISEPADSDLCEVCPRLVRFGRVGASDIRYVLCRGEESKPTCASPAATG